VHEGREALAGSWLERRSLRFTAWRAAFLHVPIAGGFTMAGSRSRLFDDIHDPRLADLVRASTVPSAAVLQGLTVAPRAPLVASAHRTSRTDRPSFGIPTPLGTTTAFRIR
jgi:hypothetical protein